MPEEDSREAQARDGRTANDPRLRIKTLAWQVHRGYPLDVLEPPVRGPRGLRGMPAARSA